MHPGKTINVWPCLGGACLLALLWAGVSCDKGGSSTGATAPRTWSHNANAPVHSSFSGEKTLAEVEAILDFGPRPPGSETLDEVLKSLESKLTALGWEVQRQSFRQTAALKGVIDFHNLRARYVGLREDKAPADWDRPVAALLGSHIDSKYYSYFEFVGANDGGSSSGALVELARILPQNPSLASNVELVFFDGEECFVKYSLRDGLYGSRHYAKWLKTEVPSERWPRSMVLLDMIGDKNLNVRIPANVSVPLRDHLFKAADEAGTREYFGISPAIITDDHEPFRTIGIPAIDVIDLDFDPYWHTKNDTIDKISAESLEIVGKTVTLFLEKHLLDAIKAAESAKKP